MSNKLVVSLVAAIAMAGFSVNASALCKTYPTRGENRSGAIGGILDERDVPAIEASDEQPCVPDRPDPAEPKGMEYNTDRMGSDYRNFDLTRANPALCQTRCSREARCKAWTYVKPGIQGPKARCWLKTSVPVAKPNACCVSGLK